MKKVFSILVFASFLFASCEKECTGATITVKNNGELQATIYTPNGGALGIKPGESASFKVPAEMWQLSTAYQWNGTGEFYTFVTQAEPCEKVEVSIP